MLKTLRRRRIVPCILNTTEFQPGGGIRGIIVHSFSKMLSRRIELAFCFLLQTFKVFFLGGVRHGVRAHSRLVADPVNDYMADIDVPETGASLNDAYGLGGEARKHRG